MSLLMKALEKAAKDRGEVQTGPANTGSAPADTKPELSLALELLAADTPSPQLQDDPPESGQPARRGAGAPAAAQARAAAVVQAGATGDGGQSGAWLREHPLVVFGTLAALFALGFGAYVYQQIYHPGFFTRPAPAPQPLPATRAPAAPTASVQPIPSAQLLDSPSTEPSPAPPVAVAGTTPAAPAAAQAREPKPAPTAARPAPEPAPPRERIVVSRSDSTPAVNPLLNAAYAELQAGRFQSAAGLYERLLKSEPINIDALLGLAAIALQAGRTDDASRHYLRILELDPRNALAQSGLIGLLGRAEPLAAETRLKQLIAREPSSFLFFTLGNLYADQSLWAQAQQAYFQAHHLEPSNPDYAYNLAVGLEHVSQPKLALDFYRRALVLAADRARVNFSTARTEERIARLASQVE